LDLDGQDLIYLDVPEKMNAQYKKKNWGNFRIAFVYSNKQQTQLN
jgi:hypothetical protein